MNKDKFVFVLVLAFVLTITGCSLFEAQEDTEKSVSSATSGNMDLDKMLTDVTAKYKALAKAGGAWVNSEDTLEKAAEAAKNKDVDRAIKLLKEVDDEVKLANAQFEQEKNARPHLF